ncbi:MAG: glycine/sarcosine/betaine reductase selenoprotein B family protein [Chloroflexi bacterium]|nr:glycine/sarcosine/betaine reductase selenoprotein B family protein [Chloroflexota bacterium]
MPIEPQDLLRSTPAAAYSKIRGIRTQPEEKVIEFINGLFRAAVESKDDGAWTRVERFLEEWEFELTGHASGAALRYETAPWAALRKPIREARVALITTGGVYIEGEQAPFELEGDSTMRVIPKDTPRERLKIAHNKYDIRGALEDINIIFPYERMKEMEAEGAIGELWPECYSWMGFMPGPWTRELIADKAPAFAARLKDANIEAAVIGTT